MLPVRIFIFLLIFGLPVFASEREEQECDKKLRKPEVLEELQQLKLESLTAKDRATRLILTDAYNAKALVVAQSLGISIDQLFNLLSGNRVQDLLSDPITVESEKSPLKAIQQIIETHENKPITTWRSQNRKNILKLARDSVEKNKILPWSEKESPEKLFIHFISLDDVFTARLILHLTSLNESNISENPLLVYFEVNGHPELKTVKFLIEEFLAEITTYTRDGVTLNIVDMYQANVLREKDSTIPLYDYLYKIQPELFTTSYSIILPPIFRMTEEELEWVITKPELLAAVDIGHNTLLHCAIDRLDVKAVTTLLNAGMNINTPNKQGLTAKDLVETKITRDENQDLYLAKIKEIISKK